MPSYKEMYFTLLRAQRDAILALQEGHQKAEALLLSLDVPDYLRVICLEPEKSDASPVEDKSNDPNT